MKSRKNRKETNPSWRYRIHDGADQFRFQLEGPLASADVRELEQCWQTASSTIAGKAFVVDLTSVTTVDDRGRELLDRWRDAGAHFVTSPEMPAGALWPVMHTALPWLVAFFALLMCGSVQAAERVAEPATAGQALTRYLAGLETNQAWSSENVEIEAALPKLKEQGRLRGIRRLLPLGRPEYQVLELNGSRTVKQQVIARYLTAEKSASSMTPSAVAVTPANYRFAYAGSVELDGGPSSVFQITPRKKREGLIQGMIWIDDATGTAVRLSGYLVKRPSIFVKRVDVTRETSLRAGVAEARVTHLALETRLVGRAELTIRERPCAECSETETRGSN